MWTVALLWAAPFPELTLKLLALFLEWVVKCESAIPSILHYLDDFLSIRPLVSQVCQYLLRMNERIAGNFGIPLAPDKTGDPSNLIKFLRILIDSKRMEYRLPEDMLQEHVNRARVARKLCRGTSVVAGKT